jgi:hypothetical protein
MTLLFLCLLAAHYVRYGVAQETNVTQDLVSIDCCEMLAVLTTYTVQSTRDKVGKNSCDSHKCLSLQVVQLFINHTRSMLDLSSSVQTSSTHIQIMQHVLSQHTERMLVLALLGRESLPDNLREEHMSLEYNAALDVLSVRDSLCSTDKTIYSTIVVASILLLVFFIACQVVETEKRKQAGTQRVHFTDAIVSTKKAVNMGFLRMNVNQ